MSTDPSAQLRHELRTPLNHIVGYAELLLEELQGDSEPDLAAGLAALRADARQLLTVLNEVLARGQAGPSDLAAARDTLRPLLERVRSASTALHRRAAEKAAAALLQDLDHIGSAVERLDQLLRHGGVPRCTMLSRCRSSGVLSVREHSRVRAREERGRCCGCPRRR